MAEISFYQLKRQPVERALYALLGKVLKQGGKAVVRLGSEEEADSLDTALWTIDPNSFLPHATEKAKYPERQPVLLTTGAGAPNGAEFAFVVPGGASEGLDQFKRAFVLFDGEREAQVKKARETWKAYKNKGAELTYWTQQDNGAWKKQAL